MTSSNATNPFPGLRAFHQDEDYLFFGREEQTMELLQRLGSNRFVTVVGTSGSGKSSLVRCGLLSELLGGKMLQAGSSWEVAVTHPGGNPMALLSITISAPPRQSSTLRPKTSCVSAELLTRKRGSSSSLVASKSNKRPS